MTATPACMDLLPRTLKNIPEFVSCCGNGYKGIAYNNFSVVAIQAIPGATQIIE